MFRAIFFAHPQERKTVFYSIWYNAPKMLPVGGLEHGGRHVPGHRQVTSWVHYTTCCKTQSCAPEDGQKIALNMLS